MKKRTALNQERRRPRPVKGRAAKRHYVLDKKARSHPAKPREKQMPAPDVVCDHLERKAFALGMCQACYMRRYRGSLGYGNGNGGPKVARRPNPSTEANGGLPPMPAGPQHHCFLVPPTACPKCAKAYSLWAEGRELHCRGVLGGCGWTGYLVSS